MGPTEEFKPPITFDAGGGAPSVLLHNPSDLLSWVSHERDWLISLRANPRGRPDPLAQQIFQPLIAVVENNLNELSRLVSGHGDQAAFTNAVIGYANQVKIRNTIYSGSRIGTYLTGIAKDDSFQAQRIAACYCRRQFSVQQTQEITSWIAAGAASELLELGLTENVPNLDKMMQDFSGRWSSSFAEIEAKQRANRDAQAAAAIEFSEQVKSAEKTVSDLNAASEKAITSGEEKIDAFRKTYNAELALRAPTTYWRAKQTSHWLVAAMWAGGFVVIAGLATWGVYAVWDHTVAEAFKELGKNQKATTPPYGAFLPVIAASFLAVWVLRIISRQLLVHFALASDAGERVSMVQTFLALMQMPDHVKEDDRILILSALFRPSARTDEDAAPPNWFDLLMQRVKPG